MWTYLFLLLPQAVPHGGHYFGDVSKGGVGVLPLDGRLGVPEEQGVRRHGLRRFIGVLLFLLLWGFGLGLHDLRRWPLLPCDLQEHQRTKMIDAEIEYTNLKHIVSREKKQKARMNNYISYERL